MFREALDPDQPGGSAIQLPPDTRLLADLASTKFSTTAVSGRLVIQAERKEDVVSRLGRSPDKADAVVMCWYKGVTGSYQQRLWGVPGEGGRPLPKVIRGHEAQRRR